MPLTLSLVFHFNQHTNEYVEVADRACYRGLLTVLRAHPDLKFNLHLSGTLLRALIWYAPETVELVRAGLADGQFELLGSTYAQNVLYACDDWDNARQIDLHRQVLQEMFGVRPTAFWNAERSWRQSLAPLIADAGYKTVLLEDHMLRAGGLTEPLPVSTDHDGRRLTAVWDDIPLRERFNFAAWFGRRGQLLGYLRQCARRPGAQRHVLAYAEDAEAMGLWNWERGYLPQAVWANLDRLLADLDGEPSVSLCHLSSVQPVRQAGPFPDAAAEWMDRALLDPDAPYHEDGFDNWFQFLGQSPKVRHFRKLYSVIRTVVRARAPVVDSLLAGPAQAETPAPPPAPPAAVQLHAQAVEAFCHHQYEFGCIGVGGRGYWGWENVRSAFTLARVSQLAQDPRPGQWVEDINADGSDEQVLSDGRNLLILTARGGRVLYWFDVLTGRQWIGNQLAVPTARFDPENTGAPQAEPRPRVWLPDSFEPDLRPFKALRREEPAPTRLGSRMAKWLLQRGPERLTVYRRRIRQPGSRPPMLAQWGALITWAELAGQAPGPADALLDYRFEPGVVAYIMHLGPGLVLHKRLTLEQGALLTRYSLTNDQPDPADLRLTIANEFSPDYQDVVRAGRPALGFHAAEGELGVINTLTGAALVAQASQAWERATQSEQLLALRLELVFGLTAPPGGQAELNLRLHVRGR